MTQGYEATKLFSEKKLEVVRSGLADIIPADAIAITTGSYARREASEQSDLDYFIATDKGDGQPEWASGISESIAKHIPKPPSQDGAFDAIVTKASLLENIGGDEDSNKNITRRMLLLLEGEWLTNRNEFNSLRQEIIERYVGDGIGDHKIALFLLNDVIRYWRTITVDYVNKTTKLEKPKPWAVRKLKLTFSRKLLYAGGLFSVGQTADCTPSAKRKMLETLFDIPALDRIEAICGKALSAPIKVSYDRFLNAIADKEFRGHLDSLPPGAGEEDLRYREINSESHIFTRALLTAFENTYHASHPVRRAVIF